MLWIGGMYGIRLMGRSRFLVDCAGAVCPNTVPNVCIGTRQLFSKFYQGLHERVESAGQYLSNGLILIKIKHLRE
jgi:hypothetical protein